MISLAGDVQSDKGGGTTGHIGIVIPALEFALLKNTNPFVVLVHPGAVDYLLPVACTTNQQRLKRKQENDDQLQVFEMEQILDKKLREQVFFCFEEYNYMDLWQDKIGYTNVTTL